MSKLVMARCAFGCLMALAVVSALAGCREGSRAGSLPTDSTRPAVRASASASDAGSMMPVMEEGENTRTPIVAPVAAKTNGSCPGIDTALVEEGREVFEREGGCYACHGPDARGSGVGPGLTGSDWLDTNGSYPAIAGVVQDGIIRPRRFPISMPPMGGADLDGEQVCAVAAYVFSLSH